MDFNSLIKEHNQIVSDFFHVYGHQIDNLSKEICHRLQNGNKILSMGNGGSASDAAHFSAELTGRFEKERKAFPAIDLTSSNATITAISNDYSYENVFARQIEAFADNNDILLGISTSGASKNVLRAFSKSRDLNLKTLNILLTSQRLLEVNTENLLKHSVDYIFRIPTDNTARCQEVHIMFLHVLAQLIEDRLA